MIGLIVICLYIYIHIYICVYIYICIYSVYTTYNTHSVSSIRLRFTMPADPPNYTQSFDTTRAVEHLIRSF